MVTFAKLVLIILGIVMAFFSKAKSGLIFGLGLATILVVGFFVMTDHVGAASELSVAAFIILILSLFRYLVEIKLDEK